MKLLTSLVILATTALVSASPVIFNLAPRQQGDAPANFTLRLSRPTYYGHSMSAFEGQYLHVAEPEESFLIAQPAADGAATAFFDGSTVEVNTQGDGARALVIETDTGFVTLVHGPFGTSGLGYDQPGAKQPGLWSDSPEFNGWYMCPADNVQTPRLYALIAQVTPLPSTCTPTDLNAVAV